MATPQVRLSFLLLFLFLSSSLTAPQASTTTSSHSLSADAASPTKTSLSSSPSPLTANPFAAKAAAIRYWDRKIPSQRPHPAFLLSKLSPLSVVDSATYSSLAASDPSSLTVRLPAFCAAANLLCSSSFTSCLASHSKDSHFANYNSINFTNYDKFQSYGKGGNNPIVNFTSYGHEFKTGNDHFTGYGEGTNDPRINFKTYLGNPTEFKVYADQGVTFKDYRNITTGALATQTTSEKSVHKSLVEPGRFFRESELKEGTLMPMPDIHDKMPARSFLPRVIADKLPFRAQELARIFNAPEGTALARAISDTVAECSRAPSRSETKRCPTSAEDMIDFATSVLGDRAVPRSTDSALGSGGDIVVGKVTGLNGGKVTKSVSCHQSLFPYLVYYCHSVPMVRVYEAEILSAQSKHKINHGVAICHLDTSDWSSNHGAFVALGSEPGKIEVCHWIFQGDLTWVAAD